MADKKISQLNILTKATVANNDVLPVVDTSTSETKKITYQELIQPQDNQFGIASASDITKLVKFDASSLSSSTTRTITIPDANLTIVGTNTTQTLTNKTISTGTKINTSGSDGVGAIYYRDASGNLVPLPIGSAGQILDVSALGLPEWIPNPAAADASTTVKGVAEEATQAEVDAGTATGGTGARLFVNPSTLVNSSIIPAKYKSFTASGSILQNDVVAISASNTVKSLYPSAQGTGSAISTNPSHTSGANVLLPLSTSGLYINFSGGNPNGGTNDCGILYAQVRTINAGETDFSNGSEVTIYGTGNGVRSFSVANISTDKFLVIYQADTAGAGAGIKAVVCTVSGTTITVGTAVSIESVGSLDSDVSVSKLDTDKAIIYYVHDADDDLYCQFLSVSGTSITTNTPVKVKAGTSNWTAKSIQLSTNTSSVVYSSNTTGILYGVVVTVSGTTPTIGAEQTIVNTSASYQTGLTFISSTKALLQYSESSTPTNDQSAIITFSGNTMTKGSNLAMGGQHITKAFQSVIIGTKYALCPIYSSNTQIVLYFLDISGSTPSTISTQNLSSGDTSGIHNITGAVKILPWTYVITGSTVSNSDYIVKLTVSNSNFIGISQGNIADATTGNIMYRYTNQTLGGITLTGASTYYVDDTGQITTNTSLTAPRVGFAINTTDLFIQ